MWKRRHTVVVPGLECWAPLTWQCATEGLVWMWWSVDIVPRCVGDAQKWSCSQSESDLEYFFLHTGYLLTVHFPAVSGTLGGWRHFHSTGDTWENLTSCFIGIVLEVVYFMTKCREEQHCFGSPLAPCGSLSKFRQVRVTVFFSHAGCVHVPVRSCSPVDICTASETYQQCSRGTDFLLFAW